MRALALLFIATIAHAESPPSLPPKTSPTPPPLHIRIDKSGAFIGDESIAPAAAFTSKNLDIVPLHARISAMQPPNVVLELSGDVDYHTLLAAVESTKSAVKRYEVTLAGSRCFSVEAAAAVKAEAPTAPPTVSIEAKQLLLVKDNVQKSFKLDELATLAKLHGPPQKRLIMNADPATPFARVCAVGRALTNVETTVYLSVMITPAGKK